MALDSISIRIEKVRKGKMKTKTKSLVIFFIIIIVVISAVILNYYRRLDNGPGVFPNTEVYYIGKVVDSYNKDGRNILKISPVISKYQIDRNLQLEYDVSKINISTRREPSSKGKDLNSSEVINKIKELRNKINVNTIILFKVKGNSHKYNDETYEIDEIAVYIGSDE